MDGMDLALPFPTTADLDLLNLYGCLSFDLCKIGQFDDILYRAKYAGLVIMIGAGGVGLYRTRYKQGETTEKYHGIEYWIQKLNLVKWIFENDEENEKGSDVFFSTFLKGYNFGLLSPECNEDFASDKTSPARYYDLSLNSLTTKPNHQQFLKPPFYSKEGSEKVTQNINSKSIKGSNYKVDDSKQIRDKRMPFKTRMKTPKDKLILQRVVATNRLSFKFYQPGCDLRMDGDGEESTESVIELPATNNPSLKLDRKSMRGKSPGVICTDPYCKSPHCLQTGLQSDEMQELNTSYMSNNMMDFLQNAEELRRFIRETSFDSLASDLSIGINFGIDNDANHESCMGLYGLEDIPIPIEIIETRAVEDYSENETNNYKYLWKPTKISPEIETLSESSYKLLAVPGIKHSTSWNASDAGDDVCSFVGSGLDPWEWDDDCYYGDDTLTSDDHDQFEHNTQHMSWLPDACRELDLESELGGSKTASARSSRSSSVRSLRGRRAPPSGSSSVERQSLSRQRTSSTTSEDNTITCSTPDSNN